MKKYLVDANVIHAWANKKDRHHRVCKEFLEETKEKQFHFPMHGYFEMYASIARRKRGKDFIGPENDISLKGTVGHNIDEKFFQKCKEKNYLTYLKNSRDQI